MYHFYRFHFFLIMFYRLLRLFLLTNTRTFFFQSIESKQHGSAVRVHLPRSGADERKTGTHESLDFDKETNMNAKRAFQDPTTQHLVYFLLIFLLPFDCRSS